MKCSALVLSCTLSLMTSWGAAEAQPTSTPSATAEKPGTIRGRVTSAHDGRPLRRAHITLSLSSGAPARIPVTASANSQGVFQLKEVPPGSYFVLAARSGHLALQHGQRRPRERGLAVEVGPGETIDNINIALPRGSVIAGRLTDEVGEPYPGVRVTANEIRYMRGRRALFPAGSALTDDQGRYRISGMPPGNYLVSALSPETWKNEKKETLAYSVTYYPGTAGDAAQTVTLDVAQERVGMDFSLFVSRTGRISGRVQQSNGAPLAGEAVSLARSFPGTGAILAEGGLQVRTSGDGTFDFRDVPPGDYQVRTTGRSGTASLELAVAGDVENLLLVPRTGSTVTGNVVTESGAPPPFPVSSTRVLLVPGEEGKVLPTVRLPALESDWSFRLANLGGPFLFRLQGLPADWMIEAVKINDSDITDVAFDVPVGSKEITGLQIVISQKIGTVNGLVVTADGKATPDASVFLFSEDEALWTPGSRFVRMTRPGPTGEFAISGLPAATYFAVASDNVIEGQWEDPAFLDTIRSQGTRITLLQGRTESVTLKLPKQK